MLFCTDVYGYNAAHYAASDEFLANGNDEGDPMDVGFHGTHCAGIAAAVANNAEGVAGMAGPTNPVRIMACNAFRPVASLNNDLRALTSDLLDCLM